MRRLIDPRICGLLVIVNFLLLEAEDACRQNAVFNAPVYGLKSPAQTLRNQKPHRHGAAFLISYGSVSMSKYLILELEFLF